MKKNYRIADRVIEISSIYPDVHEYCKDYITEETLFDISVETTLSDIRFEKEKTASAFSDTYLEKLAVCRKIAEHMPAYDTFLFHGSAIAVDGKGYIFTAKSGTGKSTHAKLWRELLGNRAVMVNDDKPFIRVADNEIIVYGSPYNGKHHLGTDIAVPVKAICILNRAADNNIKKITPDDAYAMIIQQSYRPYDVKMLEKTLFLLGKMIKNVELYRLDCNMDISAAKMSYEAMKG